MSEEKNELIEAIKDQSKEQKIALFTQPSEFEKLMKKIKAETEAFEADVSTASGRAEIKSLAYKVTRTKTTLDGLGKKVKEDAQKTVDSVDETRRKMRIDLEAEAARVRKPLTDWEDAEEKLDAAANGALDTMLELKMVPFDATAISILQSKDRLKFTFDNVKDWRGKKERAEEVFTDVGLVLDAAHSAAVQREEVEAQNKNLEEEKLAREEEDRKRREKEAADKAEADRVEAARIEAENKAAEAQRVAQEEADRKLREANEKAAEAEKRAAEAEQETLRQKQELEDREKHLKEEAELRDKQEREKAEREAEQARIDKQAEEDRLRQEQRRREELAAQREVRISETVSDLIPQLTDNHSLDDSKIIAVDIVNAIISKNIRNVTFS